MKNPGFNVQCQGEHKVRWGYCSGCIGEPCDSEDADGAIGLGLSEDGTSEMGAGWTNLFGPCHEFGATYKKVWIWVGLGIIMFFIWIHFANFVTPTFLYNIYL